MRVSFIFITFLYLTLFSSIILAQDFGEQTNGPFLGTMYSLSTDLDGVVFAGNEGNFFRSSNQGDNWVDGTSFPGFCFATNSNEDVFVGSINSIKKSTDEGISWINVGTFSNTVMTIAIDTNNILFAGTSEINPGGEISGGFFYSTNSGTNWIQITIPDTGANSIVIHPNGTINVATSFRRTIRSTDFGTSWTFSNLSDVYKLAKDNFGALYAISEGIVFRSLDAGLTWNQIFSSGFSVSNVVVDEEGTIFISKYSGGISYSTDYGTTWNGINVGNNQVYNLALESNGTIYASLYDTGIYRSTDNGVTWIQRVTGFPNQWTISLSTSPSGSIFAGTYYSGIWRSTDDGNNWTRSSLGHSFVQTININPDGYIYAGTWGALYISTDNGFTWVEKSLGIVNPYIYSISINSTGNIFVGTSDHLHDYGNVFKSTDNGVTWLNILSNIFPVSAISTNGPKVYVGTNATLDTARIYRSLDNGLTWNISYSCSHYYYVSSIAIASNGVVYAGIPNIAIPGNGFGIIVSTDGGETWVQKNTGLTDLNVSSIAINASDHIFVGTRAGTFFSTNNGDNWINISSGLRDERVYALTINNKGFVYAGTSGVARSSKSTTSVENENSILPESFLLFQNFPNPFNPSTTISYQLPKSGSVTLKVYDILGNEVAVLVNEERPAGYYEVEFSPLGVLASGIYFYKLVLGDFSATKKLVLMK